MPVFRVKMPQLGESVRDGTIVHWLVKPGDSLVEFEPMLEIDTDKVSAQIPAPTTGTVRELLVQEGDVVPIGVDIAVVEIAAGATPRPAALAGVTTHAAVAATPEAEAAGGGLSPAVAALAQRNAIDLSTIVGTGASGRVTKRDVLLAMEGGVSHRPRTVSSRPEMPIFELGPGDELVPLTRMRRLIADNMTRSKTTIPHAWQTQEVDMTGVVANREVNKARFLEQEGFGLSYVPYVLSAAIAGLRAQPNVNATFTERGIIVHHDINLGVAVGLDDSVIVPVIKGADRLSIADLARRLNDLSVRAKAGSLTIDDISGGTFTVNNSGTFGTMLSYSVISPGQAGILTMGVVVERPVVRDGEIDISPMMYLCFSLDHRILDGRGAGRFLSTCRTTLESITATSPLF